MNIGKFIVFEGINGSGKTTVINNLIKAYEQKNIKYIYLKFPNRNTESGKIIDSFLKNQYEFNSMTEQIKIFAENRKEAQNLIKEKLEDGFTILCDRYLYSNLAYTLTEQSIDLFEKKTNEYFNIEYITKFDRHIIKPHIAFLINGDYINLRNDAIQERYHNNNIKNLLIFNNYLLSLNYTNTPYKIIDNKYDKLDNITSKIIDFIDNNPHLFNAIHYI
jgi:dTMP kinase